MAWLRELGLAWGPAIVGGLAFEIAPYRVVQSAGHLLGPISLLLPLSLWALERGRRGNPAWLVLSAIAIASIPLSGQVHLAIGAVPFYAAYALARLPGVDACGDGSISPVPAIGVALAIGAGLLIDRVVVQGSVSANGRSLSAVSRLLGELARLLQPQPAARERELRLPRLADPARRAARPVRARPDRPGLARGRCSGSAPSSRCCSRSGRTRRSTGPCTRSSPGSSTRGCPSG